MIIVVLFDPGHSMIFVFKAYCYEVAFSYSLPFMQARIEQHGIATASTDVMAEEKRKKSRNREYAYIDFCSKLGSR